MFHVLANSDVGVIPPDTFLKDFSLQHQSVMSQKRWRQGHDFVLFHLTLTQKQKDVCCRNRE